MKIYIVMGNTGNHPLDYRPWSAHTSREAAEWFKEANHKLSEHYSCYVQEMDFPSPLNEGILVAAGIEIPDFIREEIIGEYRKVYE